jgi:hypothetical protein
MKEYQKHIFFRLNTDDEERFLQSGDMTGGLNLDDGNILTGTGQILTNMKGNTIVSNPNLPIGTNTVIGTYRDRVNNSVIYFVHNSGNNHSIFRYFYETGNILLVLQGAFLKFNTNFRITGIALFDKILCFTDNLNPQRRINLGKLDNTQRIRYRIYFTKKYGVTVVPPGFNSFSQVAATGLTLRVAATNVFAGTWGFDNASLISYRDAFNASFAGQLTASIVDDYILLVGDVAGYQSVNISNIGSDTINYSIVCENYYLQPYLEFQFNLARPTPVFPINIYSTFDINPNNKGKELAKNSFQFAYRYVFFDDEKSAVSPYSTFTEPHLATIFIKLDLYEETANKDNAVYYSSEIKYIELLVRTTNTGTFNLYSRYKYVPNFEIDFWNDKALQGISSAETVKLFDAIPLLSKTLEGHSGRLFLGNNTEGYPNIEPNVSLVVNFLAIDPATQEFSSVGVNEKVCTFIKRGSKISYGIVYYDEYGRSGGVNTNEAMNVYVPHQGEKIASTRPAFSLTSPGITETSYVVSGETKVYSSRLANIGFTINHQPPDWATTYQIVATENQTYDYFWRVQFFRTSEENRFTWYILGFTDESTTSRTTPNIALFSDAAACASAQEVWFTVEDGYVFEIGDRIRLVVKNGGNIGTTTDINFIDKEIIEQRGKRVAVSTNGNFWGGVYIDFDNAASIARDFHIQAEVYRPRKIVDTNFFYYEIGKVYSILNPKTPSRSHGTASGVIQQGETMFCGNLQFNSYFGYDIGSGLTTSRWDTDQAFERRRCKPYWSLFGQSVSSFGGFFFEFLQRGIWTTNTGRPNSVVGEAKTEIKRSAVRFSNKFVQNTQINGLSSFEGLNENIFPVENGEINRLIKNNDILLILQEKTAISVYIEQNVLSDLAGQSVVSISDKVLGGSNELRGNYGTKHPESAVEMDNNIYWYDVTKGAVLKYAQDGITVISDYKMQKYFTQKSKEIANANVVVKGFVDPASKRYYIDFGDVCYGYSEKRNGWLPPYSFFGKTAYQNVNNNFVIFDENANLWLQNSNALFNNFFGIQYNSEIEFITGFQNPGVVKNWQNLVVESSHLWQAIQILNENLQSSNLTLADFVSKEGKHYAQFLRDQNTPNVTNAIFRGDELKSIWLRIRLVNNTNTEKVELYYTNIGYSYSGGHTN